MNAKLGNRRPFSVTGSDERANVKQHGDGLPFLLMIAPSSATSIPSPSGVGPRLTPVEECIQKRITCEADIGCRACAVEDCADAESPVRTCPAQGHRNQRPSSTTRAIEQSTRVSLSTSPTASAHRWPSRFPAMRDGDGLPRTAGGGA